MAFMIRKTATTPSWARAVKARAIARGEVPADGRGWIARAREIARRRGKGLSLGDGLDRNPSDTGHLVRYGEPQIKEWNRPMSTWEAGNKQGLARQLYRDVRPFLPEVEATPFEPEDYISFGDVQADVQAQPSWWQELFRTGTEFVTQREQRKLEAERAKIAEAQARQKEAEVILKKGKEAITEYWPYILGLGGGALLLTMMLRKKR